MAAARRRRRLFPLRPRPLPPQRLFLAAATAAAFTLLFLALVLLSTSSPSSPPSRHHVITRPSPSTPHHCAGAETGLGELGDEMVSMLPKDLPFTVFAPSADAFRRVLNLRPPNNGSAATHATEEQTAAGDEADTYAVLSRVLGFSAVPRRLLSADVAPRGGSGSGSARAVPVDSVSGLRIHVARDDGARGEAAALVANGVRSECVDVVRGETVVHVMAGVLMDAEFERSVAAGFDS